MPKATGRWPALLLFALLLGCGGSEPAPTEAAQAPPEVGVAPALDGAPAGDLDDHSVASDPAQSEPDTEPDDAVFEEADTTLDVSERLEALLADGSRPALRRALTLLLDARAQSHEPLPDALVARVVQGLIDWDTVALLQGITVLAQRDLPLLQRWNADHPGVIALDARLRRVQDINARLARADRLEAAGHIVGDGPRFAVTQLNEVVRLEPDHAGAQRRLDRIERRLIEAALAAAHAGDFDRAMALLADAGKVRPESANVQNAAARVMEIREQHLERQQARIAAALATGDVAQAQALLPRLDALAMDERPGMLARARIERVRLYGAYDAGALFADPLADGGQGPGMVVIPAGSFKMGSPRGEVGQQANERPQRDVRFARGFAVARTETTVAQFRDFIDATAYRTTAQRTRHSMVYDERGGALVERRRVTWKDDYAGRRAADDMPVIHVSWEDAQAYAQWLAESTAMPYRLPSEAEFEYVLRAGSTTAYPWGDGSPPAVVENLTGGLDRSPSQRSWANAFEGYGDGYWGPAPVASFASNPFGLTDINGNVSEWVQDCWHDSYARAPRDGKAWVNPGCKERVIRGASWASSPLQARSAFRTRAPVETVSARVGFRVARDL